ncbi:MULTISPECIES: hypothetical protein [unclassified Thioalkalivibrio]|uniref:hypothetical protein n=1 Tax=unclassified Thioalkalivibrio TaxID=2621013 RepID=UPI0003604191|nr:MULTISPECIES: hypothetical protein [unclassified Thioalkalivibrio]
MGNWAKIGVPAAAFWLGFSVLLAGCGGTFPQPGPDPEFDDGLSAEALFQRTLAAHGGDLRKYPGDLNQATDGEWGRMIQRLQPLVADGKYRGQGEERYRPADDVYAVHYTGPEGTKSVFRHGDEFRLYYDGERSSDRDRIRASAMTTDAGELFHYGPSFVKHRATAMERLADQREGGVNYRRVLATIEPGFGEADEDRVVMWIHPETDLLYRVHVTLNGFGPTQGAHVDTTFLEYAEIEGYTLPTRFEERVRGPLRLFVHEWWVTGRDSGRGWATADVRGPGFSGAAAAAAADAAAP